MALAGRPLPSEPLGSSRHPFGMNPGYLVSAAYESEVADEFCAPAARRVQDDFVGRADQEKFAAVDHGQAVSEAGASGSSWVTRMAGMDRSGIREQTKGRLTDSALSLPVCRSGCKPLGRWP